MTLSNLQEVFDQVEEFILPKVLRLNFRGSGDARAKKKGVQNHLLAPIKEASAEEIVGDDLGDAYPFVVPPSKPSLPPKTKKTRGRERRSPWRS